jgi:predicted RNA-binding protein associated with RNAse of E/G family
MSSEHYKAGAHIVLREMWDGKIWGAYPVIVVQDTPDLLIVYRPTGSIARRRVSLRGDRVTAFERKHKQWLLSDAARDDIWMLKLTIPDESYSVIAFWNSADNSFRCWYINLEDVARRSSVGIDYTDLILDVIIQPNLKDWYWEDEDELYEAIEAGLISNEKAEHLYSKGAQVRDMIMSGKSVFNVWQQWRPDPTWLTPVLPVGWDAI